jgi:hypothetical protein
MNTLTKLSILAVSSILLSGCLINQVKDKAAQVTNTATPTPNTQVTPPDPEISMAPVSEDASLTTIEQELNATDILEEDFSDL